MSATNDDDSFSKVGFDEEEEADKAPREEEGEAKESKPPVAVVKVELPPHFSAGSASDKGKRRGTSGASLASEASSFIPVSAFGKMKVAAQKEDKEGDKEEEEAKATAESGTEKPKDEEARPKLEIKIPSTLLLTGRIPRKKKFASDDDSEWSAVSSCAAKVCGHTDNNGDDDNNSVAAGSTISGFDLISLNGSSKKKCKACSFLNAATVTICKGCDRALVANPCLTADEKLAQQLQQQEEEAAYKHVLQEERKRKNLSQQPVLFRAQTLVDDIYAALQRARSASFGKDEGGFVALPHASLTILASRFIDSVDELMGGNNHRGGIPVRLCFCFTDKANWRMRQIRQDGFGPNANFGSTPEAAGRAFGPRFSLPPLFPIQEDGTNNNNNNNNNNDGYSGFHQYPNHNNNSHKMPPGIPPQTHGWIAAIINDGQYSQSRIGWQNVELYHCAKSSQSLPLVSFDASLVHNDMVQSLLDNLTTTCNDFFGLYNDLGTHQFACTMQNDDSAKRRRMNNDIDINGNNGTTDNDAKIAMELQAMLYEDATTADTEPLPFRPPPPAPPAAPQYSPTSPQYSPTSPVYSPPSPAHTAPAAYGPTNPACGPAFAGIGAYSPQYSPTSPAYRPNSPAHSAPAAYGSTSSPQYSPTSPVYSPPSPAHSTAAVCGPRNAAFAGIGAYSPRRAASSPAHMPATRPCPSTNTGGAVRGTNPAYLPATLNYSPATTGGAARGTNPAYLPATLSYSPATMGGAVRGTNPAYMPATRHYSPATQPAHTGAAFPTGPAYSVTRPGERPSWNSLVKQQAAANTAPAEHAHAAAAPPAGTEPSEGERETFLPTDLGALPVLAPASPLWSWDKNDDGDKAKAKQEGDGKAAAKEPNAKPKDQDGATKPNQEHDNDNTDTDPRADDGLVRVGTVADDSRERNIEVAATMLEQSNETPAVGGSAANEEGGGETEEDWEDLTLFEW